MRDPWAVRARRASGSGCGRHTCGNDSRGKHRNPRRGACYSANVAVVTSTSTFTGRSPTFMPLPPTSWDSRSHDSTRQRPPTAFLLLRGLVVCLNRARRRDSNPQPS